MRHWKTHDLCDLFRSFRQGYMPIPLSQFTNYGMVDWRERFHTTKLDPHWPQEITERSSSHSDWISETGPSPTDEGVRNPNHAALLCCEGVQWAISAGCKEMVSVWCFLFDELSFLYGIEPEDEQLSVLGWAKKNKKLISSMINKGAMIRAVSEADASVVPDP